jgi:protein involved in polysaccharide export with SLBB domain
VLKAKIGLVLALAVAISGCATAPLPAGPATTASAQEYRLGAGDKLRITTFNEPNLTGEFVVSSSGAIALPLAGEIPAKGSTPSELEKTIQERLASGGFVLKPRVSAEIIEYRPYYILGEVTKPGQYNYLVGLTVSKAVATAGGFTYRANTKRVFITRDGGNQEEEVVLTAASPVGPGDTIRVGERYF